MAVRFTSHGSGVKASEPERGDLAAVVDLRTRLAHRGSSGSESVSAHSRRVGSDLAPVTRLAANRDGGAKTQNDHRVFAESDRHADAESDSGTNAGVDSGVGAIWEPEIATVRTVNEDGVRLLSRKARSSGELRRELIRLGHDAHEVDRAILDFESSLYLDDLGLARVLVEKLRDHKRASRMQIRMKLRERSLPDGVIDEALGELDDDEELELLRTTAAERASRLVGLDRATAERRLLGFLARRGWSGDQAFRVAREALDGIGANGGVRFR